MGQSLARSGEQFRQSDVTFWGIIALVFATGAMMFANLSAIFPANMMTGLHSTRLDGGSLNHLRTQVADLQGETVRIRNENDRLMTMITLAEQDQGAVNRRIGAIESSLPLLMEQNVTSSRSNIDHSIITAAIGTDDNSTMNGDENVMLIEAEGGVVAVSHRPLEGTMPEPKPAPKEMLTAAMPVIPAVPKITKPRIVVAPPSAFGIALGPQVTVQDAFVAWKDITAKVGPLLLGLGPLLSGNAGAEQQRLVAGPITDYAQAEQLCVRVIRIGISCLPVPYAGHALPE